MSATRLAPSSSRALLRALGRKRKVSTSVRCLATDSAQESPSWSPAVPPGTVPAYDAALELLSQHKTEQLNHAESLRKQLAELAPDAPQRAALQSQITSAEINGLINDPAVRWQFERMIREDERGEGGSELRESAVFRQLADTRWRTEGGLDLLMHRITQMSVVPDLVGSINPCIDLSVTFAKEDGRVVPGSFVLPSQTTKAPEIRVQSFAKGKQDRLYTLVMVDPDYPDPVNHTFREYCHWIIPNIPVNHSTISVPSSAPALVSYQPPHPVPSTPYHRYTLLLIRQPRKESFSPAASTQRNDFNLRQWMAENGYESAEKSVQGIHMFREGGKKFGLDFKEESDEYKREMGVVEAVYREHIGEPMPTYVKAPKEERYGLVGRKGRRVAA